MVFLFICKKFLGRVFVILLSFLYRKKLVPCAFVIFAIFSFEKSFWMGVFVIRRLSFVEIVLHWDSTTVEIISKNNVFLICFTLNGVSLHLQKISREGIRHFIEFFVQKKTRSMRIRHLCHFFF